ncbi:hypothetical protein M8J75_014357 [Diaphorina citri]|nr:hypothetical protein M8J75_014357 [Diaphorina citri]
MCSKTKICADCSATDPKWSILNKGVLVCDACCSIHRSLGRHISQVKYLEPSTWPPSLLSMLMTLTNGGAPSLWEHSLCESKTKKKPVPSDPLHPTKAEFIKAKYEQLSFMIRSNDTQEELNQQLHSSVRTSNLDTSLRLLSQGADPNYFYQDKGNRPLHVAASAGQLLQLELLMIYGADAHLLDSRGNTVLNLCTTDAIRDRLVHCMYEATDRFIHYLTGITPDHANNQHYILPHTQCNKTDARHKLMKLSNSLLEDLVMDVYDELDRREVESIWQSVCQPPVGYELAPLGVPFLPVNRSLSSMRNQGRQKLGRLNEEDFNTLVTDIIYIAVQRGSHDKLQRKLLDDEPLYDSVASDEEQQVTPTTNLITTKQSQLESQLMISEAHITHLNNEIAKLKTQVQQVIGENETLKAALNARNSATHHQPPETEPVSDSSWCSPQRPASMYNVTVNAQSTTTRMPQSEEVVRRTDQVTKRIQELAAHMRSSDKCHSFVPHAERIRIAVSELSAIFPQNTNNDLIRHALRSLNTSTVRLQAECAQLEGSAERVRSCAYNMAKANKQLLTQFQ